MADESLSSLEARLHQLEQQVRELRSRLIALERTAAPRADNPADQTSVREKVVYDWQS